MIVGKKIHLIQVDLGERGFEKRSFILWCGDAKRKSQLGHKITKRDSMLLSRSVVKPDDGLTYQGRETEGSFGYYLRQDTDHESCKFSSIAHSQIDIVSENIIDNPVYGKEGKQCQMVFPRVPSIVKTT